MYTLSTVCGLAQLVVNLPYSELRNESNRTEWILCLLKPVCSKVAAASNRFAKLQMMSNTNSHFNVKPADSNRTQEYGHRFYLCVLAVALAAYVAYFLRGAACVRKEGRCVAHVASCPSRGEKEKKFSPGSAVAQKYNVHQSAPF